MPAKEASQESFIDSLNELSIESPPPNAPDRLSAIPIIHELGCIYIVLHKAIRDFEKLERYTLGTMIEKILLECIESCFASTVALPEEKVRTLTRTSALFDSLKLYIRISKQVGSLQEKTYIKLIPRLGKIGRMLGGWIQKAKSNNPNQNSKS